MFPASSRVNAFFALTVRLDDGHRLLMGQSVLRIHKLGGARFYPYGYFATFAGDFALPIEDGPFLDEFCESFDIVRGSQAGLSVVIPFPDSALTPETLFGSVVRHYFVPILAGDLVAEIAHDGKTEVLDAASLMRLLSRSGWDNGQELQRVAELARWGLSVGAAEQVELPAPPQSGAPRWNDDGAAGQALTSLTEAFNRGDRVALKIPIWVKPTGGSDVWASFDAYLERDETLGSGDEHFVREGITVAGVRGGLQAGVRAIVYVRDRTLSALLGDSENPAHTEWQERSLRFKERYRHGPSTLRYVKSAPREIVGMLTRPGVGRDYRLLHHIFSREVPTEEAVRQRTRSRELHAGVEAQRESGDVEAAGSDRFFQLQKLQGGFRIAGAGAGIVMPAFAGVQMAYEVRRGNPFSAYQPLDFEVDRPPIEVERHGAEVVKQSRNLIVLRIQDPDFKLAVRGFDSRRDVRVKVIPLGEEFSP